jgi:hypothetical protein
MIDNNEILNGEYDGLLFNSVQEAARCVLLDHLTVTGEHGPEYALEIAYTEGQANIMAEIQHCYSYTQDQLGAISDAWDDAIEWLTNEATKEFDTSFDAADLF